jgi:hypothetical protein
VTLHQTKTSIVRHYAPTIASLGIGLVLCPNADK